MERDFLVGRVFAVVEVLKMSKNDSFGIFFGYSVVFWHLVWSIPDVLRV